jgi:hypothetical protein
VRVGAEINRRDVLWYSGGVESANVYIYDDQDSRYELTHASAGLIHKYQSQDVRVQTVQARRLI